MFVNIIAADFVNVKHVKEWSVSILIFAIFSNNNRKIGYLMILCVTTLRNLKNLKMKRQACNTFSQNSESQSSES